MLRNMKPFWHFTSAAAVVVAAAFAVISAARMPARAAAPGAAFPEPLLDDPLGAPNESAGASGHASVVLAGGCFWGVQAVFQRVKGVANATSGYSGGSAIQARYEIVSTGRTGHAESVKVEYDPAQITYGGLLKVFFSVAHDPTELNRQGPDEGPQYRSAIFYGNEKQQQIATAYIDQLNGAKVFRRDIVTRVVPLQAFYAAENYHQNYADRHPFDPYIMINDRPKVDNLRKLYPAIYVERPQERP